MATTKQTLTEPLPSRLAEPLDRLRRFIQQLPLPYNDRAESLRTLDQIETNAKVLAHDLRIAKSDLVTEEGKVADLEEKLETQFDASSQNGLVSLKALRDPNNWTDEKWAPVLGATEPDIHRYMDQVFKELGAE